MTKLGDRQDKRFVLFEQLKVQDLLKYDKYKDHDQDIFEMVLSEAEKMAENVLWPLNEVGDQQGCVYKDGEVKTPDGLKEAYKSYAEAGWITPTESPEDGGQGLPETLHTALLETFQGANMAFCGYPGIGHGSGALVKHFGTDEQKEKYLQKLWTGEWAGTMCLTEPAAGSDLAQVKVKAIPQDDGTYLIEGNKIFITCGQHDVTENIIHPVLARIEGDKPGPKGISLFIVPRNLINDDGTIGPNNDVTCAGIEHKMGIKASATSQLVFGDQGKCAGELLGERGQGLAAMFHMMNEERLAVANQGAGQAATAYQLALAYSKERIQGRLMGSKDFEPVTIINHPDIRRMLMEMKSMTEGMRALNCFTGLCIDMSGVTLGDEQKMWAGFVEILTPIVKSYSTDKAFRVCETAMQTLGGYGYCSEYRVEQCARDVKITSIYEGTNGIQAMDLLGRKIPMAGGKVMEALLARMDQTISDAENIAGLKNYAERLEQSRGLLVKTTQHIAGQTMTGKLHLAFLRAAPLLDIFGDVLVGWMLLWQAVIADKKLNEIIGDGDKKEVIDSNEEAAFLDGKIMSAKFFIGTELLKILGKVESIMADETAALDISEKSFS
jgi:alkylation response protein AidB-like acyl-CoA dehydrogenase